MLKGLCIDGNIQALVHILVTITISLGDASAKSGVDLVTLCFAHRESSNMAGAAADSLAYRQASVHCWKAAGVGVVARDSGGIVLWALASRDRSFSCSSEAEGKALVQALRSADRLNVSKACFEVDSHEVFRVVSTGLGVGDWCSSWLETAVDLLRSHSAWIVSLVPRECNVMADWMASKARKENWSWSNVYAVPYNLSVVV
ncbi:hypothetical protein QQ045_006906 [Rhodiola kirilowii]